MTSPPRTLDVRGRNRKAHLIVNSSTDGIRTETLLADVARLRGAPCPGCRVPLDGRGVLAAIWLGFRDAPRCAPCVARSLDREPSGFFADVRAALRRRDCFREAWETVLDQEGIVEAGEPSTADRELGRETSSAAPTVPATRSTAAIERPDAAATAATATATADAAWDAGDLGCGDLVLELRTRLRAMAPGALLALRARDPGAPEDIPAWCGLTGHGLVSARHPDYLIRRKDS